MDFLKKNNWVIGVSLGILIGFIVTIFLSKYINLKLFEFSISNLIVVSTIIICFIVVKFIRDAGLNSNKKTSHSFGLPAGTVRATLALVLIVFFVLLSLYSIGNTNIDDSNQRLVSNILTTLATLVISAVSFYFGVKATEQGGEIATNIFNNLANKTSTESVPTSIIQEAINQNKSTWIKEYSCIDIRLGKKKTQDGQIDLDCLVFIVGTKLSPADLDSKKPIPSTILFNFHGKSYSIPTDVREGSETQDRSSYNTSPSTANEFEKLTPEAQQLLIREFIAKEGQNLKSKYPEIQGITDFKKNKDNTDLPFYAIQFKVAEKRSDISQVFKIPDFFPFKGQNDIVYNIPTDIEEEGKIRQSLFIGTDSNPRKLGVGISRQGVEKKDTGTIGLKVKWNNLNCILSCYHVLCAPELRNGTHEFSRSNEPTDVVISPSEEDRGQNNPLKVGNVVFGIYSHFLDIALAKLNDDINLDNEFFGDHGVIGGFLNITLEHEGKAVKMVGRTSQRSDGTIYDHFQPETYVGDDGWFFKELIVCRLLSNPGDSGAVVVEKNENKVIGILIASSDKYSYLIRIQHLIDMTGIQLL